MWSIDGLPPKVVTCSTIGTLISPIDAHVKAMINRLSAAPTKTIRKQLETDFGVHLAPRGILFCSSLMANVMHPVRNYLRDWMHTLVSNGVAGTHLALLCQAIKGVGCDIEVVRAYAQKFTLPYGRNRGKVSNLCFKPELLETDHVRHFASDVLTMIPIMYAFLIDKIKPRGWLASHIVCFEALHVIISILRGGEMSVAIHGTLLGQIIKHNTLFLELYGNEHAKIKFHHLFHLPDDMLYLGGCYSCFPTERKNKDAIAVSVATDRKVERTSTIAFLQRTAAHFVGNDDACTAAHLHSIVQLSMGGTLFCRSVFATLPCGDVHVNDMLLIVDGSLGKVIDFWQRDGDADVVVRMDMHSQTGNDKLSFASASHAQVFESMSRICEPVAWHATSSKIVACIPLFS